MLEVIHNLSGLESPSVNVLALLSPLEIEEGRVSVFVGNPASVAQSFLEVRVPSTYAVDSLFLANSVSPFPLRHILKKNLSERRGVPFERSQLEWPLAEGWASRKWA